MSSVVCVVKCWALNLNLKMLSQFAYDEGIKKIKKTLEI